MTKRSTPSRITVSKEQLSQAGNSAGLLPGQTELLWNQLSAMSPANAGFGAAQVAWYFGAAVILAAMSWLMIIIGDLYGNGAILGTSLVYTGIFALAGSKLAGQDGLRIPGGLLYALAAAMTPVTMSAAFDVLNLHLGGNQSTLLVAGATVLVGVGFTLATRIAFVSVPAVIAGWMAAVAGAELLFGPSAWSWEIVSAVYGAVLVAGSLSIDGKSDEDYSFWGYLVGAIALYAGLTFINKGDFGYLLYAGAGVFSMLFSVLVSRRIFAFAGAGAVLTWLGHLTFMVFANSAMFPLVLTVIGIGTIYGGVVYHRNRDAIDAAILRLVPEGWRPQSR